MNRNLSRLMWALVISASCFMGTVFWFESGKPKARRDKKQAVARLNEAINEVQRKPVKRVIWESISRNEDLFPGEAIRTAPNAEAKILFVKTGVTIQLDPDSLVVLEENDKGLSLDFLQGNLFVQSTGSQGAGGAPGGLTVKTGSGEINLKSADLSLSKDQSGKVNLEVYQGQAEFQQGGQKIALEKDKAATLSQQGLTVSKDRLQLLTPQAGESVLLNLSRGEKMEVTWKPLPPGYQMRVEVGANRSKLRPISGATSEGQSGRLAFSQRPGKWYLRLSAIGTQPGQELASMVIPFTIQPKSPPSLLEPARDANVLKRDAKDTVTFRWINRHDYQSQVIEVAKDPQFKNVIAKLALDGETTTAQLAVSDGKNFWRVTGFLKVKEKVEGLSSGTLPFNMASNWEVKPPKLATPVNLQRVNFMEAQRNGVTMKWNPVEGITEYRLVVHRKTETGISPVMDDKSSRTFAQLDNPKPGTYVWKVSALDPRGGNPKTSEPFEFSITDMPAIEWVGTQEEEYRYSTPTPSIVGQWKPLEQAVATYRYRLAPIETGLDKTPWKNTKQNSFDVPLTKEGKYIAVVEALNEKGQVLASSRVRSFDIKPQPLLPAPRWAENSPEIWKSDNKGNLSLGWEEVEGAKKYLLILENSSGQVLEERPVERNTASLNRLKPGDYQVRVKAVDAMQRPGPQGESKKLQVPTTSDIRAPKIKTMKVK